MLTTIRMKISFFILDVFTEHQFSGNQLAVFLAPPALTSEQMQNIAREMHFSETTFIISPPPEKNRYPVRIFTPEHEVPFAGHPVLGTAFVIREEIMLRPQQEIILDLPVGSVPVSFSPEIGKPPVFWMKQPEPVFTRIFSPDQLAPVLSLPENAIDKRFPIEEVSTGLPFIIVPITSLDGVRSARINLDAYTDLIAGTEAKAIHIFCKETYHPDHTLNARMFGPYYGVMEDPATGSANGCLAGYLVRHQYFDDFPPVVVIEQGYEIRRPSLVYSKTTVVSGKIGVEVGGSVVMVARGQMVVNP